MTRLGRPRESPLICETCIEAVQSAGFGDLDRHAARVATIRGDNAEPHECEFPECECACIDDYERRWWKARSLAKLPRSG